MIISHIGSRGIPAVYSGVENAIEELSKRLVEQGIDITVYCHSKKIKTSYYSFTKLIELPTIHTKHLATIVHSLISTIHVIFTDTDIVHYHGIGSSIFSFIPRIFGKKTIVTVHALDWKRKKWNKLVQFLLKLCEISALYFPNKTIVVSKHLKNYFKNKYNKETYFIPNGVNIQKGLQDTPSEDYILFVGRLVPEKGIQYLIRAFNDINTDKELWIAGQASYTDWYFRELKKISQKNIRFLGPIYGEKLSALYNNAYIFVLPSEIEGCPIALLEAMSHKKCCLISNIPECVEIGSDCTMTFENKDHADLKKKLELLLNDPQLVYDLGKKAWGKIKIDYDWGNIVLTLKNIYLSLDEISLSKDIIRPMTNQNK
ncbi:MAG: glycosyltransferase family 4 protein [Candidatus Omnitrophota bacterium]